MSRPAAAAARQVSLGRSEKSPASPVAVIRRVDREQLRQRRFHRVEIPSYPQLKGSPYALGLTSYRFLIAGLGV